VIDGKDQWVLWKECRGVTFINQERNDRQVRKELEGKFQLKPGTSLFLANGYVKEQ
jgi:hypothetical protein